MAPSGTPASPPIRNGQTSDRSKLFHIEGSVESCAITEQISTSGTACDGGSTYSQMPSAISAVPNPASPETKPPASAPKISSAIVNVSTVKSLLSQSCDHRA